VDGVLYWWEAVFTTSGSLPTLFSVAAASPQLGLFAGGADANTAIVITGLTLAETYASAFATIDAAASFGAHTVGGIPLITIKVA
jgi:hypothetical protein